MEIDYVSIGKRIREARKAEKMTQADLAELSGVEPSNISHIERAATKVSLPTLLHIANALNVSLDELVCGSLIKSSHVLVNELDKIISDCNTKELHAIIEIVKTTKDALRYR